MEKYDTLEYYNKNAQIYFKQTIEASIEENYGRFLSKISPNSYILDFGCGSGRDSKYFLEQGYKVKAIDGVKLVVEKVKIEKPKKEKEKAVKKTAAKPKTTTKKTVTKKTNTTKKSTNSSKTTKKGS